MFCCGEKVERTKSIQVLQWNKHCKAFLFPTFYEGFGIPPLEAMSVGAKIVVSDTSCMREIYENAAYYIDPYNPNINLDQLLDLEVIPALEILNKFSWKESAYKLYEILYNFKEEEIWNMFFSLSANCSSIWLPLI